MLQKTERVDKAEYDVCKNSRLELPMTKFRRNSKEGTLVNELPIKF